MSRLNISSFFAGNILLRMNFYYHEFFKLLNVKWIHIFHIYMTEFKWFTLEKETENIMESAFSHSHSDKMNETKFKENVLLRKANTLK